MARKYSRDNRGRFASKGTGATARGGRLKTAGGNKREMQAIKAASGPAGTIGKPSGLKPGAISGKVKPAAAQSRATQLRQRADQLESQGNRLMGVGRRGDTAMTNMSLNSRARTSEFNQGIKGLEMSRQASRLRDKANNVETRAQQSAAKSLREAAKPKATRSVEAQRISRAKQTEKRRGMNINNPAAWRQDSAGKMAANAAQTQQRAMAFYKGGNKAKAASSTAKKPTSRITPEKVSRVTGRVNTVTASASVKSGVKRLNSTEVGVRAKAFLTRKAGGMSGTTGMNFAQQQSVVAAGLKKPTRYSTQTPNRNKPLRYNALGQDKARAAARVASQTASQKIAAATAKPARSAPASRSRLLGRRELVGSRMGAGKAPVTARAGRIGSTVKRPAPSKPPTMAVRTRKQSKSAQRFRREGILTRTRQPGAIGLGGKRNNPRIQKQQTGMSQLSLIGKPKALVRFRPKP
jgi:hypothetical protein